MFRLRSDAELQSVNSYTTNDSSPVRAVKRRRKEKEKRKEGEGEELSAFIYRTKCRSER